MSARRAQLFAETVCICCPYCGEPQPNASGSEMWIPQDIAKKNGLHRCVSCDREILILGDSKVQLWLR